MQMLIKMFQEAFHEFVSLIKNQFVEKSFPPLLSIREKIFFLWQKYFQPIKIFHHFLK